MISAPRLIPVGLLTSYVRELLEGDPVLSDLWVEGEISNLFRARSGHVYFTLRGAADDGQIKCALFRSFVLRQSSIPENGDQVAAHGRVSLYERDGALQFYVDVVENAGLGVAALQLERLRQRLTAEGLFDPARKRSLPTVPRAIGVVTSADGAVWHDIQQVIRRRYPLTRLILSSTIVQGSHAPGAIVAAIEAIVADGQADVVILARGGGSAEDLSAFNDESVVRAVFACRVPIVTGVGHETDFTLVDDAADLRAPTPSAAAELCVPSIIDVMVRATDLVDRLRRTTETALWTELELLAGQRRTLLRVHPQHGIDQSRRRVAELSHRTARLRRGRIDEASAGILAQRALLGALDPRAVLHRGYASLTDEGTSRPVFGIADAVVGTRLRATLRNGAVIVQVAAPTLDKASSAEHRTPGNSS